MYGTEYAGALVLLALGLSNMACYLTHRGDTMGRLICAI